ncbi:MAG: restriction endonuclease subunit S, partial [Anaerolineae bacterium]
MSSGVNLPRARWASLRGFRVAVPALPEQRRIARVLRTIRRAIAAQDDLITAAKETNRSLIHHFFTYGPGAAPVPTKDTEIGQIPEHWEIARFEDVCAFLQYGTSKRCSKDPNGTPVLRIPNVIEGRIDISDLKFIELPEESAARLKLEIGDLLFVRTNGRREYTGRSAVFK